MKDRVIVGAIGFGIWKWSSRPQAPALEQPVGGGKGSRGVLLREPPGLRLNS